ncbi:MAG: nucleoside 2-deoxyribosyltransferase [Flavobacteriaceae bacterium]|nr:nucleoside 2-deoxyribosyltransferase [Flavobacteriaceae bacterium]
MKKGYFAISFADKSKFTTTIDYLVNQLTNIDIEILVFVDKYHFEPHQEKEMMTGAFAEIEASDFLIAELTHKSIGVGIEMGYAFATKKPIIYVRQKGAEYSTTTAGCSESIIEYDSKEDLADKVLSVIKKINYR